jgi:hypothetical protein
MTRTTNARVAGFTYLFYAAIGIGSELLMQEARGVDGDAAKLARLGQYAANVRLTILITLLECLSALVLGVTLYGITRGGRDRCGRRVQRSFGRGALRGAIARGRRPVGRDRGGALRLQSGGPAQHAHTRGGREDPRPVTTSCRLLSRSPRPGLRRGCTFGVTRKTSVVARRPRVRIPSSTPNPESVPATAGHEFSSPSLSLCGLRLRLVESRHSLSAPLTAGDRADRRNQT